MNSTKNHNLENSIAISKIRGYDVLKIDGVTHVVLDGLVFDFSSFVELLTSFLVGNSHWMHKQSARLQEYSRSLGCFEDYSQSKLDAIEAKIIDMGGGTGDFLPFLKLIQDEIDELTAGVANFNQQ